MPFTFSEEPDVRLYLLELEYRIRDIQYWHSIGAKSIRSLERAFRGLLGLVSLASIVGVRSSLTHSVALSSSAFS